jgi:hypothetical protein
VNLGVAVVVLDAQNFLNLEDAATIEAEHVTFVRRAAVDALGWPAVFVLLVPYDLRCTDSSSGPRG